MRTKTAQSPTAVPPPLAPELVALTEQRLAELDRLRNVGFVQVGRLNAAVKALPPEQEFKLCVGNIKEFDRIARAIRQIVVLEFELRGLFEAPDRDAPRKLRLVKSDRPDFEPLDIGSLLGDLHDYNEFPLRTDYRGGPLDEVVAGIREVLGTEAPPNDPFAPPADRKPAAKTAPEPVAAKTPPRGPEYYMRARPAEPEPAPAQKQPAQNALAVKAADLVMTTLAGKGFRQPSKAKIKKHRQGRGPPK